MQETEAPRRNLPQSVENSKMKGLLQDSNQGTFAMYSGIALSENGVMCDLFIHFFFPWFYFIFHFSKRS